MVVSKYKMSFTTGGLLNNESVKVAELYLALKDWDLVREQALAAGLMQTRMQSSSERVYREVSSRLKTLNQVELELLVGSIGNERLHLLWLAVCLRYSFIHEFAVEVLHERFLTMRFELVSEDFEIFFSNKAEWNRELDTITVNTRNKLRQNLFRMLREAQFLTTENFIQPTSISPQVASLITLRGFDPFSIFPTLQTESQWRAP